MKGKRRLGNKIPNKNLENFSRGSAAGGPAARLFFDRDTT
jgi:hypothetical protein